MAKQIDFTTEFLQARDITKMFGEVAALNGVDFTFEGGVLGLVGPNGAGKTTLIKLIAGLLRPSSGVLKVFNEIPFGNLDLLNYMGYSPEIDKQFSYLTGKQFVEIGLKLRGYSKEEAEKQARNTIKRVELNHAIDRKIKGYSRGMRQRIKVAQAIAHDPQILLLDEPLQGADPIARNILLDIFKDLGEQGKQLIISSHILYDLQKTVEYVILFYHGKVIAEGKTEELRAALKEIPLRIEVKSPQFKEISSLLIQEPWVDSISVPSLETLVITTRHSPTLYHLLPKLATEYHWELFSIKPIDDDLEAVFNYVYRRL